MPEDKEEEGRGAHNAQPRDLSNARDLLCKRRRNSANSKAPSIRRCRLKTWPISGENKKEASPEDARLHKRKQAHTLAASKQSNIFRGGEG